LLFSICPSCGQKRTLLPGEYLSQDLLLQLPHRQFVFTLPKCLRVYLKNDRALHAPKRGHFRGEARYFSGLDFIARITLHIPPKGKHLVRRYGVYSSRTRGTWKRRPALALRAAEGWYGRDGHEPNATKCDGAMRSRQRREPGARRGPDYSPRCAKSIFLAARSAGRGCLSSPLFAIRMRFVRSSPVWKATDEGHRKRWQRKSI
jgi:hypothetical protein